MITELWELKNIAAGEAYKYFDKHIRNLPKLPNGEVDSKAPGLEDNDADAFRHAYVSAVYTQVYGETTSDILGRLNELDPMSVYSNSKDPGAKNMDLWNNSVGRKYGKTIRNREELLKKIHEALKKGELITSPEDSREYKGVKRNPRSSSKPVIVLNEDKSGRNELFLDTIRRIAFTCEEFIARIQAGEYPGYAVKTVRGKLTPVSNPDGRKTNNLA